MLSRRVTVWLVYFASCLSWGLCWPALAEPHGETDSYNRFRYRDDYPVKPPPAVRVSLPLYAGVSLPHDSGEGVTASIGQTLGVAFGAGVSLWFARRWGFGVEILYITKGYRSIGGGGPTTYSLSYIEFPIQVRYSPSQTITLHAGPYLGSILVSARQESALGNVDVRSLFGSDYGISLGVQFGFRLSRNVRMGLDVRYDWGLVDIENDNDPSDSVTTRSLIGMVTLDFKL